MRDLLARELQGLLAYELGDCARRQVGPLLGREVQRPLRRAAPTSSSRSSPTPSPVLPAHRVQRMEVAEARGRLHLRRECPGFRRSTLFTRSRPARRARARAAMNRSPAPIRSRAASTKSTPSTSSNDASTVRCMRSVSASSGRWKPGRSTRTSWPVFGRWRRREIRLPRRLRLVRDDRHLAAGERVHERRLADVRPSGDGDEARSHTSKSQVSGSSSAGVRVTTSPPVLDRSRARGGTRAATAGSRRRATP